ncbi:ABC transporter ATP-binding protein [Allorhizobium pseudoryzae]|uniref:ABC transporter ATP-binding protein n=1 Tax=Allorhizobium pseudoryzae TaxID=379684 RepID=UPI003D04CC30
MQSNAILEVEDLHGWYDESHILHGVTFNVHEGEVVTLLGRNGSGRTTTLRAIMGMIGRRSGSVRIKGDDCIDLQTYKIARLGIGYCPEERGIFASLTAEENLLLPPALSEEGMTVEQIYDLFPNLRERAGAQGTRLSGGEQQMLAIARILRTGARLLLLDEISEGLAPVIVQRLGEIVGELKRRGYTIVMVEQNFHFAAPLSDRLFVMEHGKIVMDVMASEIEISLPRLQAFLGV